MIGKTVRLDDDPMTIIGVMPKRLPASGRKRRLADGAVGADRARQSRHDVHERRGGARVFDFLGRLKPGATLDGLHAQLAAMTTRLARDYPDSYPPAIGWQAEAIPLAERVVGKSGPR